MAYKFRIASMNSCGHGSFSEPLTLQTIQEGTPTAPTSIKIARVPDGAHLSWQPPPTRNITEYTVQLAIRPSSQNQQSVAATFVPVYMGSEPSYALLVIDSAIFVYL
jgi:host cell factor